MHSIKILYEVIKWSMLYTVLFDISNIVHHALQIFWLAYFANSKFALLWSIISRINVEISLKIVKIKRYAIFICFLILFGSGIKNVYDSLSCVYIINTKCTKKLYIKKRGYAMHQILQLRVLECCWR